MKPGKFESRKRLNSLSKKDNTIVKNMTLCISNQLMQLKQIVYIRLTSSNMATRERGKSQNYLVVKQNRTWISF